MIGNFLSIKGKGALEGIAYWQHEAMDLQHLNAPLSDFLFHVWPNVSHWLFDLNFQI